MEVTFIKLVVTVISTVVCASSVLGQSGFYLFTFHKEMACRLQERLNFGCAVLQSGAYTSLVRCATSCRDGCSGFSVDAGNSCYHHTECLEPLSCAETDVQFPLYYKNLCDHKGMWNTSTATCKCSDGWVGSFCERRPQSCKELSYYGYDDAKHRATFLQLPDYPSSFLVYCSYYRDKSEFYTYILKNNGTYDNTLTWNDYVNGFFHDENNYWIGLDKIKALNDAGLIYLSLRVYTSTQGILKIIYKQFYVGSADTGYNFTVGDQYETDFQDCFRSSQGIPFSTWDNDNDWDNSNCGRDGKAGWWFGYCHSSCNPMGPRTYWQMGDADMGSGNPYTFMYFASN